MINVFEYTDFRKYLADYYKEQKFKNPAFSYKYFAEKAGFRNKGFVHNIINGDRNLSKESIVKISLACKHTKYDAEYFENLVAMNQAKEYKMRKYFYERLEKIKNQGRKTSPTRLIIKDQYEFYSKWYHSAIRSLINNYQVKDDYKWLAKNVNPSITPTQAKRSVELLKRLGFIKKQKDGFYGVTDKVITTGKEVVSIAVADFHLQTLELAQRAIKELPKGNRNITGLTLGISHKTYEAICEKVQEFQSDILEMAANDNESDRVYQFDFNLFPISNLEIKGQRK